MYAQVSGQHFLEVSPLQLRECPRDKHHLLDQRQKGFESQSWEKLPVASAPVSGVSIRGKKDPGNSTVDTEITLCLVSLKLNYCPRFWECGWNLGHGSGRTDLES